MSSCTTDLVHAHYSSILLHCQRNVNNKQTEFSDSIETSLVQQLDCTDCQKRRIDNRRNTGSQLMVAGGSQVPATSNVGHWDAVVGEVRRCLMMMKMVVRTSAMQRL